MQASIYNIKPFDANYGTKIQFNWGGNLVFAYRCIIVDNDDPDLNNPIYDQYVTSMKLEHDLDPTKTEEGKSFYNNKKYIAYITVFDDKGNESELQTFGQLFQCIKTPIFEFINIANNGVINASSYTFQMK